MVTETTLGPDERQIHKKRRVAVDLHLHPVNNPDAGCASRAPLVERRDARGRRIRHGERGRRGHRARTRFFRASRRDVHVVAVVRDNPDFAGGQGGVRLDAIDERRAARGGRKHALERNNVRRLARDDIERPPRIGIRKRDRLAQILAFLQEGQVLGGRNQHGGRHSTSV